jgi:nucleoside-diphosphate-sugar epimerase
MHYLVTGAQGFLGHQLIKTLISKGVLLTATGRRPAPNLYECDLTIQAQVRVMIDTIKPDRIIHCAAYVPQNLDEYQDSRASSKSLHMLESLLSVSRCPVVFISSMTVYGTERDRPITEDDAGDPTSAYGQGKWLAESLLKQANIPAMAIRIPGLFGPQRRKGLVFNLLNAFKHGHNPHLPNSPILWAAMHVDHAAQGIAKLALSGVNSFEAINLGYQGVYSINSLVNMAASIYGHHFEYLISHPNFQFDLTRAEKHCAVPSYTLRDALIKFGNQI